MKTRRRCAEWNCTEPAFKLTILTDKGNLDIAICKEHRRKFP